MTKRSEYPRRRAEIEGAAAGIGSASVRLSGGRSTPKARSSVRSASAPRTAQNPRRVASKCICRRVCWFAPAAPCRGIVLARRHAEPGREFSPRPEQAWIADRGCDRARPHDADAWNRRKQSAEPVGAMPLPQPRLNLTDLGLRIVRCAMMSRKSTAPNSGKPALFCSIAATNRSTWRKPCGATHSSATRSCRIQRPPGRTAGTPKKPI